MTRLASCYFCGTAMDDTLREYRVVPAELRDDAATTATLCPTCHGKLERLLAPVAEAAGEDDATLEEAGDSTSPPEPTNVESTESESTGSEPADAEPTVDGLAVDELADDEPAEGDAHAEASEHDASPPANQAGGGGSDVDGLQEAMEPDVPDPLQSGDDADDSSDGGRDAGGGDGDGGHGAPAAEDQEPEAGGKTADTDNGEGDSGDQVARTTVSALEYNKVMRLLQNREFPVDRAEIEAVAANAYGLAQSECAEVIDLAVDRGLIDENGGQLVRPE